MATIFVSRHPGAIDWARRRLRPDAIVEHLDPSAVRAGDRVMGTLPVHLAAEVCTRGAEYWHLRVDLPAEARGRPLSERDLDRLDARLERYTITAVPTPNVMGESDT